MELLKTALHEEHIALNAKMLPFAGWEMPIQYKNLKEEVQAVRQSAGMFDVSHMGEFFVTGTEALNFVDYIVTNDIQNSEINKAIYSPICREDGTIIDDLIVYKFSNESLMICVNAANIEKDFDWMKTHVKNFNCELTNKSDLFSLIALQGPESFQLLKNTSIGSEVNDIEYYSIQILTINDENVYLARTGYTGEDGFEIFGTHSFIKNIWKELNQLGVTPCGLGARDVLRLEVCYPLYGNELDDTVTPLDTALKWTVKLNKKSFIGLDFLKSYQPKYKLFKFQLEKGIPRQGYKIKNGDDKEIGYVTSGSMSVQTGKGIALARVTAKSITENDSYFIEIRGKNYQAIRTTKPFVTGGHK